MARGGADWPSSRAIRWRAGPDRCQGSGGRRRCSASPTTSTARARLRGPGCCAGRRCSRCRTNTRGSANRPRGGYSFRGRRHDGTNGDGAAGPGPGPPTANASFSPPRTLQPRRAMGEWAAQARHPGDRHLLLRHGPPPPISDGSARAMAARASFRQKHTHGTTWRRPFLVRAGRACIAGKTCVCFK